MIRKIIYALLTNTPAISAQVGTRIYPLVVPEDVQKPALAYQVISESRDYLMSGQDAVTESRVQITIVAESVSQMDTVAEALRSELSGYSGMVQSEKVYLITLENEYDGAVAEGENLRILRQDYHNT